jgi:hypothetical protein
VVEEMPRGPNSLKLTDYAQAEAEYTPADLPQTDREEELHMEEQFENFSKNMKKYDEILAKVALSIDYVMGEEYFITDFYPSFVLESTYTLDDEKKIFSNDPELKKII